MAVVATPLGPNVVYRAVLATVAGAFSVIAAVAGPGSWVAIALAMAACGPIVVWLVRPTATPMLVVLGTIALVIAAFGAGTSEPLLFIVSVAAVIAGTWEPSIPRLVGLGLAASSVPVVVELAFPDGRLAPVWVGAIVLPLLLCRAAQMQLELATELASAREQLALSAVAAERRQIARDVHDLVGHGLAAVMIQVTGARHVLRRDVDAADEALAEAETLGKRSLAELRTTLALLRGADDRGTDPPLPTACDIEQAVTEARHAGLDVAFHGRGPLDGVDPVVGLSLHRVTAEALANARRHAPEARTTVALDVGDDRVELTIESIGPLAAADTTDDGRPHFGLIGMSERMAAVGGTVATGPTATGWSVSCRAPRVPVAPVPPGLRR